MKVFPSCCYALWMGTRITSGWSEPPPPGQKMTSSTVGLGYSADRHRRRRRRLDLDGQNGRTLQQQVAAYQVPLFLELQYLDQLVASQLEGKSPTNVAVEQFCMAVNTQASSNPVNLAANQVGATVSTRVGLDSTGAADYQCTLIQTNRVYDDVALNLLGPGYFILELAVVQIVYVTTATNHTLSSDQVQALVERGFTRGYGGRVKFQNLLRQSPLFQSIINVDLLNGALSAPQAAPSDAPSRVPLSAPTMASSSSSDYPSHSPSLVPTWLSSSNVPSTGPTPLRPTRTTTTPSTRPSRTESNLPTAFRPSQRPTINWLGPGPAISPQPLSTTSKDRQPLILGAIAGGVATILVSCFFIWCVWFPFCSSATREKEEDDGDDDVPAHHDDEDIYDTDHPQPGPSSHLVPVRHERRKFSQGRKQDLNRNSSTTLSSSGKRIPGTVNFDENQSLANTTLGDFTAGGERPPSTRRLVDTNVVPMLDSFDEGSIYTSPLLSSGQNPRSSTMSTTEVVKENGTTVRISVMTTANNIDPVEEDPSKELDESDSDSSFPIFTEHTPELDEEKARAISRSEKPAATKGFDPFADDDDLGSFGFRAAHGNDSNSDSSEKKAVEHGRDLQHAPSSTSSRTKKMENLVNARAKRTEGSRNKSADEEKRQVGDSSGDEPQSEDEISIQTPKSAEFMSFSRRRDRNDTLLRNVLEDARRLSEGKSPSGRSRMSRQSAPSRINMKRSKRGRRIIQPPDLLADHQDLERVTSARSPRVSSHAAPVAVEAHGDDRHERSPPYRTRFLERNPPVPTFHFIPQNKQAQSTNSAIDMRGQKRNARDVTPTAFPPRDGTSTRNEGKNERPPAIIGEGATGARARNTAWKKGEEKRNEMYESSNNISEKKMVDDSSSESGISTPWLFDTIEQTLGPRSPSADIESMTVRSGRSHRSTRSTRSRQSNRSSRSRSSSATGSRASMRSKRSRTTSPRKMFGGDEPSLLLRTTMTSQREEQKVAPRDEAVLLPRTLEEDLGKLDFQLAGIINSEPDQVTTSSITASSVGGASRRSNKSKELSGQTSGKKRVIVIVPPGKLGVVLRDRHDGRGTFVAEVRSSSAMHGMLSPGDKLVAIDGEDCSKMFTHQITSLMESKADKERRLTVITESTGKAHNMTNQEAKQADNTSY